ncbi:hypothetical protein D3C74_365980 [compost metagenome]
MRQLNTILLKQIGIIVKNTSRKRWRHSVELAFTLLLQQIKQTRINGLCIILVPFNQRIQFLKFAFSCIRLKIPCIQHQDIRLLFLNKILRCFFIIYDFARTAAVDALGTDYFNVDIRMFHGKQVTILLEKVAFIPIHNLYCRFLLCFLGRPASTP